MARFNKQQAESLLKGLEVSDPRLHDLIRLLLDRVHQLDEELHPTPRRERLATSPSDPPLSPQLAGYIFTPLSVRITWISTDPLAVFYELRKSPVSSNHNWDDSFFITKTPAIAADIPPITVGVHYYLIKSVTVDGVYSTTFALLEVIVPDITQIGLTATVVDNTVMLFWTEAISTFMLEHYLVEHVLLGADTVVGRKKGTFTSVSELVAGVYTYRVTPIDIVGNMGPPATIDTFVNQPPDFDLQEERVSTLNGTRVNVVRVVEEGVPRLLATVKEETWEGHFLNNGWDSPQEQIDDLYPRYTHPAVT
jgi:hypothetical protein